jgi:peptidoglycan pentaglycine glycine transferase (the first glycine)
VNLTARQLDDTDRQMYEDFVASPQNKPHATFLHTWEWGEVLQATAQEFVRLGLFNGETLVAVGQFARQKLRIAGSFWYCPRGLVLDYSNEHLVKSAYGLIRHYFKTHGHGAAFLRVDPDVVRGDPAEEWIDTLKPGQAAIFTQAERVWLVDIQKNEQDQLAWMQEHGLRSNIPRYLRKAARAGVTVRASSSVEDLEKLISMLKKLDVRKGGIGKHHDEHYRTQFSFMSGKGYEKVFLAEKDGQILTASLIAIYGREASYLHGASSDQERDLSAPHTLHFETMKYLMVNNPGVERYNFWGIVGDKNRKPSHPRHGYSEFKRSFGGYKQQYIRARDFIYNPAVWAAEWALAKYRTVKNKND